MFFTVMQTEINLDPVPRQTEYIVCPLLHQLQITGWIKKNGPLGSLKEIDLSPDAN